MCAALAAIAASASAAIVITNVQVTGANIVNQSYLGNNGYTIVLDANNSKVTGRNKSKQITLTYTVSSTDFLTGFQFAPLGTAFRGDVATSVKHVNAGTFTNQYAWSSPLSATSVTSLTTQPVESLALRTSYNVTSVVDLSTLNNNLAVASLSQFNFSYQTQPVPEPASMLALGAGALGLFVRRRSRRGNS